MRFPAAGEAGKSSNFATQQAMDVINRIVNSRTGNAALATTPPTDLIPQFAAAQRWEAAQMAAGPNVTAQQGSDFAKAYQDPATEQLVNASLADFDADALRQAAQLQARRDMGAAFGERAGVLDAVRSADMARARASLAANMRSQAFRMANELGHQDADRFLSTERSNQNAEIDRVSTQAGFEQAARQANANAAYDASDRNAGVTNQFNLLNDQRRREASMAAANAGIASDRMALDAALAGMSLSNQKGGSGGNADIDIAERLTGIAKSQAGLLGNADAAEVGRIGALSDVGRRIDSRNQAYLSEPLDALDRRSRWLNDANFTRTSTTVGKDNPSFLDSIEKIVGIAGKAKDVYDKYKKPKQPPSKSYRLTGAFDI